MPPELSPEAITTPTQPDPSDSLVTATPEVVATPPQEITEPPKGDVPTDEGKVYQVPEAEFRRLKEKAQEKGRKAALAELATQAKEAGYESVQDAFAEMASLKARLEELSREPKPRAEDTRTMAQSKKPQGKKPGQHQPRRENTRGKGARMEDKSAKEISRLERDRSKAREQWRKEEKRRKTAERRLAAKEAEIELRQIAMEQGVKDVDYAIRLMTRELQGKSKEDLSSFDEKGFFSGLKADRPYLFGEITIPATTGTGAGDEETPPVPKPGEVITNQADTTQFDARTASKEDVNKRMRELGLNTSGSVGMG